MSGKSNTDLERIENLLERAISASNRTTHAVRSFVGFILIQLSFTTAAAVFWNIAQSSVKPMNCVIRGDDCEPIGFLVFLAAVIFIVGVIISSRFAWSEFHQSEEESVAPARVKISYSNGQKKASTNKCRVCTFSLDEDGKCTVDMAHKQF